MNILFVTAAPIELNSSSMIGNISLISGLIENNCKITVLCANTITKNKLDVNIEKIKDISIYRIGKENMILNLNNRTKDKKSNFKKYLKKGASIYRKFSLLKSAGQILKYSEDIDFKDEYFDIVISASDPRASHVLFKKIKHKVNYGKWYQYWGDPLAKDITDRTIYPFWYKKIYEYNIIKKADKIIYVTPQTLDMQKNIFPNLSNKMIFYPIPYLEERIYKEKSNKITTISYIGGYHSKTRNIMPLYNYIKQDKRFKLIIAGSSDLILEESDNIKILGHISQNEAYKVEEESDILICIANKSGTQIPAKPNYCSATNREIIFILDGEKESIYEYLSTYNRFKFCENTKESIGNILKEFINKEKNNINPCKELSAKYITKKILEI